MPDSNITGGAAPQPVALIAAEQHNFATELQNKIYTNDRLTKQTTSILKEVLNRVSILEDMLSESNSKIETLSKIIENQQSPPKSFQVSAEPLDLALIKLGEVDLLFENQGELLGTNINNWLDYTFIYLSFGQRIKNTKARGGSCFVLTKDILELEPCQAGKNAKTKSSFAMTLGTHVVQSTYINSQVYLARTRNNKLLIAANNANCGAHPLTIYGVTIAPQKQKDK